MIIPMNRPSLGNAELKMVADVFGSGWLGEGRYTELFEKAIFKGAQSFDKRTRIRENGQFY